ncbi:unnamed protein product [Macrosiphum euphorbiae]|uniref:2-phosphoxylose phosphatase 1 n=1 Tax=Macrosiphum euphorbiae TaxID=13131 RepID=A0AAV0XG26_9HEMI|nr:unnamed protein product [Macrosiphum euphorbiae]
MSNVQSVTVRNMTRHRYLVYLIIWLCILFPVLYFKISDRPVPDNKTVNTSENSAHKYKRTVSRIDYNELTKVCNPPHMIERGDEGDIGLLNNSLTIQGVIILTRHGDRGPMNHVRNMADIDCGMDPDQEYNDYTKFLQNIFFNMSLQFLGPFHGYPLYPPQNNCSISQLTPIGVSQMLKLGRTLRSVYYPLLSVSNSDDIIIYSTKYRRTFQSALAFMYAILSPDVLSKVTFKESDSYSYCFDHCACFNVNSLQMKIKQSSARRLKGRRAIEKMLKRIHNVVHLMSSSVRVDPYLLRDSIMTYVCHGAPLPCFQNDCITRDNVEQLFNYIDWDLEHYAKHGLLRKYGLLKSYGFALNIAMNLLKMVSESKPRLVLYSGHDLTAQYLLAAFGVLSAQTMSPHYASRLVFEVYRNNTVDTTYPGRDFYFRVIFNGKDVTRSVAFCKTRAGSWTSSSIYLCPIESAIRFIHDDYFTTFNASNYKEACGTRS